MILLFEMLAVSLDQTESFGTAIETF